MKIIIESNIYGFDISDLVVMASRANNPKRNFLFVSKVLGKHLEVKGDICRATGFLLASRLYGKNEDTESYVNLIKGEKTNIKDRFLNYYKTEESTLVIGFAETATGLGMSVASAIENSYYLTTTRESILDLKSILRFEEEHSHATTHKCFLKDINRLKSADRIILVDDEITTGKSMLNIIKELKLITNATKFTILSILDWRNEKYREFYDTFEKEENIKIELLSLISGSIEVTDTSDFVDNGGTEIKEKIEPINLNKIERVEYDSEYGIKSYIKNSGRFGVDFKEIIELENKAKEVAKAIEEKIGKSEKTLVLGHGENIYIPSRVSAYLSGDVMFKSTTRSPIYCKNIKEYPINEKHSFNFQGIKYHFYNKSYCEKNYERVILLDEDGLSIKLSSNMVLFKL